MRSIAIPNKPSTETSKGIALKTRSIVKGYPELLRFNSEIIDADTFEIQPQGLGTGTDYTRFFFEIGDESRSLKITDTWTMDLTESTIDLGTFTGGILDGIAKENGRDSR